MPVQGLGPTGLDLATLLRLSGPGPLAAASAADIARVAALQTEAVENAALREAVAQVDLSLLAPGEAPTDASIGLYTSALGDPSAIAGREGPAQASQAETILQDLVSARIDETLVDALSLALQTDAAREALELMQAVETGDAAKAAALAANLAPDAPNAQAAPPTAGAPGGQAALLANLQGLVAAAQSGNMQVAAALAQAIRTDVQAGLPGAPLPPALMQLLAPATGLPLAGAVDPMLMAMQLSLMLSAKSTLDRLRKLREDRLKIPALSPFAELEEEEARERE